MKFVKEKWNNFVLENNGLFLQSWEWGEFQKSLGRKIWRLGDCENWAALVVKHNLPLGKNYLYCPGGPISNSKFKIQNSKLQVKIQKFLDDIRNIAEQEKSIFLKIEPFWESNNVFCHPEPREAGRRISMSTCDEILPPHQVRGQNEIIKDKLIKSDGGQRIEKTLVLDLEKPEEQLSAEMKQKTRYNIKVAEKHGIKTRVSESLEKDFEDFWRLMKGTAKRNKIKIHPKIHYEKLFSVCHSRPASVIPAKAGIQYGVSSSGNPEELQIELFLAEYQNKIIAANIVAFFGDKAAYLHGASDYEYRNLMAPYLLQWEQIKEAKNRGCQVYDFWGIDEQKWPGITRFKTSFGGKEIKYVGAWDYVFDKKWYWIYKNIKKIRF